MADQFSISTAAQMRVEQSNLRSLFAETDVIFALMKGAGHRFEYVNPAHIQLLGRDATGKEVLEVQPEAKEAGFLGMLDQVFQTGVPVKLTEAELPVGADIRYFDFIYLAHRNEHGAIDGVMALASDTTDSVRARKKVEESEARLQKVEQQLTQAVAISKTGFYHWDIVRDRVTYSAQMQEDWGIADDTPLSLALTLVYPLDLPDLVKLIEKSIAEHLPFKTEYRLIRPTDGRMIWIQAQGEVRYDQAGTPLQFFGTSVDISDRKESERLLAVVTDALPVLISYLDSQHHYRFVNAAYERWFAKPRDQVLGRHARDMAGEKAYAWAKPYLEQAFRGETAEFEGETEFGQSRRYIKVIYTPDRDERTGAIRGVVGLVQDMTEQKHTQIALQEAVQARDEFLSIASHELKTPLTSIRLHTQMTRRNASLGRSDAYDPVRMQKLVEQTDRSVDRLIHLVDDMLDISRISSGKLTFATETFDLGELAREVVERTLPQTSASNISLTATVSEPISGDWDRFRIDQVITNLITNAIRYGQGTPIQVAVSPIATSDGVVQAEICVRDHGPGIAPENQERIFQRFERATSASSISGLGLGLHICREIVERHGGTIHVESQVGRGAAFIVRLPRGPRRPLSP